MAEAPPADLPTGTQSGVPLHIDREGVDDTPADDFACADGDQTFQDRMERLVHKLSAPTERTDAFAAFAEALEHMFPGLTEASLLLLPTIEDARRAARTERSSTQPAGGRGTAPTPAPGGGGADGGADGAVGPARTYDWSNTTLFRLHTRRGALAQPPPDWPLTCSAAFYAAAVADGVLSTADYAKQGPHFLDWKACAERGAVSMASVPVYCWKRPVAALTLASRACGAFVSADTCILLSAVLSPYVQSLEHTSRRAELERLVHNLLTPIAAELSVQLGRFKRVRNAAGEDVLCLDDTQHRAADGCCAATAGAAWGGGGGAAVRQRRGGIAAGVRIMGHKEGDAGAAREGGWGCRDSRDGLDHADLDWSDFLFNLISMCIVYAYFSKAAASSESVTAVLLCMAVAAFDILLLLMRWLWYDHYLNYGLVLCIFQVYRVVLLPIANTWMLWSLIHKLDVHISAFMLSSQAFTYAMCFVLAHRLRFLLNVPVQLNAVVLTASTAVVSCGPLDGPPASVLCMGGISCLQLLLGLLLPAALSYALDMRSRRGFMPHVQAKRWVQQS